MNSVNPLFKGLKTIPTIPASPWIYFNSNSGEILTEPISLKSVILYYCSFYIMMYQL